MKETLDNISEIIEWYKEHSSGAGIHILLDARDKLSGHSYNLAEFTADLKVEYNSKYFIRKINIAKSKQAFLNENMTLGKAENEALVKHQEIYNAQIEAEADAYKADLLLRSVYKVLDAMSQRISTLKQEYDISKLSN